MQSQTCKKPGGKNVKQEKNCSSCRKGIRININSDILCRIKGVVTPDFVCTKFKEMSNPKINTAQKYKCVDCEFFIQDRAPDVLANTGFCQLFTVRYYNGRTKNACSKFSRKIDRIVS